MKMVNNKEGIVKKIREVRDELSLKIIDMTFEQEKNYIQQKLAELKAKKRLGLSRIDDDSI